MTVSSGDRCPFHGQAVEFEPGPGGQIETLRTEYARLREEAPIAWTRDGNGQEYWSVFRYADVLAIAKDMDTFTNGQLRRLGDRRLPLESDPPEHSAIRRLLQPFFALAALKRMEAFTANLASALIEPLVDERGGDFAQLVARPLPIQVLLAWMNEPTSEWEQMKRWSDAVAPRTFLDKADRERYEAGNEKLWEYSRALVGRRRTEPRDAETDPVTALLAAAVDEETTAGIVRLLVSAGHDSTSLALGICVHYLAGHADDQARLRAEPPRLRHAIEEILRVHSPVLAMPRSAARDVEIGERSIRKGDRVLLTWAAANRDESVFPQADIPKLDRSPNPHLAFGYGIHSCLGAPLARQELRIALELLLARTRSFGLGATPTLMRMNHYGFECLPIWIEPQPDAAVT